MRQTPTHSSIGSKINIFNKHSEFLLSPTFKLSSQEPGNSINNCDFFFKFIISVAGGQFDFTKTTSHATAYHNVEYTISLTKRRTGSLFESSTAISRRHNTPQYHYLGDTPPEKPENSYVSYSFP